MPGHARDKLVRQKRNHRGALRHAVVVVSSDGPNHSPRDRIGNVSQKMLTKTLRDLERDGLVSRRVHAVVPPRVDYKLTKLGDALGEAVCGIWTWVETHLKEVERSRQAYDRKKASAASAAAEDA